MRISAACVEDENYVNMTDTRIEVEFIPQPVRFHFTVSQQSTWDAVKDAVLAGCGAREGTVRLTYADDEEERIQLSSDMEMQEAFRVAASKGNVLQIRVEEMSHDGLASARRISRSYREKESGEFVFVGGSDDAATRGAVANAEAQQTDDGDSGVPPLWFRKYAKQLKDELREEVTEEVCRRLASKKADKSTDAHRTDGSLSFQDGATCGNCLGPIQGVCYKCWECPNLDLCEACESLPCVHDTSHSLFKMRKQVPTQVYRRKRSSVGSYRPTRSPTRQSCKEVKQEKKIQKLMKKLERYNLRDANACRPSSSPEPYDCEFVCDDTIPDWTHVQPGTRFTKRWKVRNSGHRAWDENVRLKYRWGTLGLTPSDTVVEVPPISPGGEGTLEVQFSAPTEPGQYQTHWRTCGPRGFFGHRLWCNVVVDPAVTLEPGPDRAAGLRVVREPEEDLESGIPSQTGTPFNSPAGATPRKSPEVSDAEESASVLSLGSLDAEGDFEVVRLPACFNLNIPFDTSKQEGECKSEGERTGSRSLAPSCEVLSAEADDVPLEPLRAPPRNVFDDSPSDSDSGRSSSGSDNTLPLKSSIVESSLPEAVQDAALIEAKEENREVQTNDESLDSTRGGSKKPFSSRKTYKVEGVGEALPEAWVTGALSAAASVYNTARTVLRGKPSREGLGTQEWIPPVPRRATVSPMERLLEMGFGNRKRNCELLQKHDGDVQRVVEELVGAGGQDDWLQTRAEGPPAATPFECSFD